HSRRITLGKEAIWVASDGKDSVFFDCTNGVMPRRLAFGLPAGIKATFDLKDHGLRFIDLDGDGYDDIVFSNEQGYGVYLFKDMKEGWSRKVIAGKAGEPGALPMIANKGENMGFWVHSGHFWWSNEATPLLKDHVARVLIKDLLKNLEK